jgi:hypothetical protein
MLRDCGLVTVLTAVWAVSAVDAVDTVADGELILVLILGTVSMVSEKLHHPFFTVYARGIVQVNY